MEDLTYDQIIESAHQQRRNAMRHLSMLGHVLPDDALWLATSSAMMAILTQPGLVRHHCDPATGVKLLGIPVREIVRASGDDPPIRLVFPPRMEALRPLTVGWEPRQTRKEAPPTT